MYKERERESSSKSEIQPKSFILFLCLFALPSSFENVSLSMYLSFFPDVLMIQVVDGDDEK